MILADVNGRAELSDFRFRSLIRPFRSFGQRDPARAPLENRSLGRLGP
jgi:hypothetical protein